jgi:hypothetical protein
MQRGGGGGSINISGDSALTRYPQDHFYWKAPAQTEQEVGKKTVATNKHAKWNQNEPCTAFATVRGAALWALACSF